MTGGVHLTFADKYSYVKTRLRQGNSNQCLSDKLQGF